MIALQFSGGKDSIACLMLYRDRLDEITVVWTDSGDSFPETHRQMDAVRAICPNFVTVQGRQPQVIEQYGLPVDVLPVRNHAQVQYLAQQDRPRLQSFMECCGRGLLEPMHEAMIQMGVTTIIRGQKLSDPQKSPVRDGDMHDGITYRFPLQDWTDAQVMEYIKDSPLLPKHYGHANTSMDCMHCTAYLAENKWKLPYLAAHHPGIASTVRNRLILIRQEVSRDMQHIDEVIQWQQ